ncbi:amidohydrolase family protein [Thermodesulfobacteriota bacterium]
MKTVGHKAGWIMLSPAIWLANGIVTVSGDTITGVEYKGKGGYPHPVIDHGPGVIMPALVNAHTHLTLSHLSGKVMTDGSFPNWIMSMMEEAKILGIQEAYGAACQAALGLKESGVGLVGEFGPHFPIAEMMSDAGLWGSVWLELFGDNLKLPHLPDELDDFRFSYAGHAPNTVSPRLLKHIKSEDKKMGARFCIHLAESEEETQFLMTGGGIWADFLNGFGIDFSKWKCWGKRPVALADELGLLDGNTLAVHLLQVTKQEISLLAERKVGVCLCPRSNLKLHGRLPDINAFLDEGVLPAIGTDSLASVNSLSVFDEMSFIGGHFPDIRPDDILGMATVNGARAIGRNDLATIGPGKKARLIYVNLEAASPMEAAEGLVNGAAKTIKWI